MNTYKKKIANLKQMTSNLSIPVIIIKKIDSDLILHTMGPSTWTQFAYFRTIVHDANNTNKIEVEFADDLQPFCDFLKNVTCKHDLVDFALSIKHMCIMFGIEPKSLLAGRLDMLLTSAALKLAYSAEFMANYESFQSLSKYCNNSNTGIESFLNNLSVREKWKHYCIQMMHNTDVEDPRIYDTMKSAFLNMN